MSDKIMETMKYGKNHKISLWGSWSFTEFLLCAMPFMSDSSNVFRALEGGSVMVHF